MKIPVAFLRLRSPQFSSRFGRIQHQLIAFRVRDFSSIRRLSQVNSRISKVYRGRPLANVFSSFRSRAFCNLDGHGAAFPPPWHRQTTTTVLDLMNDLMRPTILALDLEGTLISNAVSLIPRPGVAANSRAGKWAVRSTGDVHDSSRTSATTHFRTSGPRRTCPPLVHGARLYEVVGKDKRPAFRFFNVGRHTAVG